MNKKEMRSLLTEAVEKWNPQKNNENRDCYGVMPNILSNDKSSDKVRKVIARVRGKGIKFDA